ncbi:unnamed protein product [Aphanomyces euteiches]|uniref:MINDY deubiquitinase domain-containing protein n=1 Tax=Aphanomyces euteiches TaxID=100861 RepID=A0A6G0WNW5_9STRA|nr:hypothetical protein Ae201684_013319 [Aphanomyces euteiches]KAH9064773.1 hypothetical protein Ae201684P_003555 [Aphanomyces euteiches]KAH9127747.1 hypothetical protein AeMF1_001988 [Aphanomyces euteiches]KAH9190878.1 hypothetical protein AeNC1_007153 [Aphanomyces euteiches]
MGGEDDMKPMPPPIEEIEPKEATVAPLSPSKRSPKQEELVYWVKETTFLQRNVHYICQNINGPCPLLAICNVLLLRGHVTIDPFIRMVAAQKFIYARDVVYVVETRLRAANSHFNEIERATLNEVIALLQTLQVGLDVNVQFHDVGAFEYTSACAIFDLLDMRLVHGWVVDPQDEASHRVLAGKSYNHIIERLIDYHGVLETKEESVTTLMKERSLSMEQAALKVEQITQEGPIIDRFLNENASQLTFAGLVSLHEQLKERELAVFFRNNHFATIFKWQGHLYLLATDAGYYDEPNVIWEKLDEIAGDSEYYTATFTRLVASDTKQQEIESQPAAAMAVALEPKPQETENDDFALALRLQQEEDDAAIALAQEREMAAKVEEVQVDPLAMTSEELEMQRQAERYYNQRLLEHQQGYRPEQTQQQPYYTTSRSNPRTSASDSDRNCALM